MSVRVVDTNVVLVANRQHEDVSPECVTSCTLRLQDIMRNGRLALDDRFLILSEYQHKTQPKRGNRPGDAFVKWALRNRCNPLQVESVSIEEDPARGFVSFPDDPALQHFDDPDRKFVAVASAHPDRPPILQAADSKWLGWAPALKACGIEVDFLCQSDIERFHKNKFGS